MKVWWAIFFLLLVSRVYAQSIKFEPLFGVEHASNRYPEPARSSSRTFFGLRVLVGVPLISLELEGTQANDRRSYEATNQKVEDQVQRLSVGLRSTIPTTSWLAVFGRAGFRGSKESYKITDTLTGVSETKDPPIGWDPYAGTGLQLAIFSQLALNAGATWFFPDEGPPDVQYTFGFTVKFGQIN